MRTADDRPPFARDRFEDTRQLTMMTDRPSAVSAPSVPVLCSDCRQPFDPTDSHRQMRTLDGQLALCSDCTWYLEHPGDARRV